MTVCWRVGNGESSFPDSVDKDLIIGNAVSLDAHMVARAVPFKGSVIHQRFKHLAEGGMVHCANASISPFIRYPPCTFDKDGLRVCHAVEVQHQVGCA